MLRFQLSGSANWRDGAAARIGQSFLVVVVGCAGEPTVAGLQVTVRSMIRHWHAKDIVVGLLVMIVGVITLAVAFPFVLLILHRGMSIGPVYLLIPVAMFVLGFYWSLRQSSRRERPIKAPSKIFVIGKSFAAGIIAVIVSAIAYFAWIWIRLPRDMSVGFVSFDVRALLYWPLPLAVFVAGFVLEYLRGSRRRSRLSTGVGE
jgi:hypothetical protein